VQTVDQKKQEPSPQKTQNIPPKQNRLPSQPKNQKRLRQKNTSSTPKTAALLKITETASQWASGKETKNLL